LVAVSKSTDGGVSWDAPKTLIRDETGLNFNDKETITADPTRPGYVYAVSDRGSFPSDKMAPIATFRSFAYRGQPMFSRTTDSGASWSTPGTSRRRKRPGRALHHHRWGPRQRVLGAGQRPIGCGGHSGRGPYW
jgi:hypothetical protein